MSNAQKTVDLLKPGNELLTELINDANGTAFTEGQLVIGEPRPSADEAYNTDIEVTFPAMPQAGDPEPDPVTGEIHYTRYDLGRLFAGRTIRVRDSEDTPLVNTMDVAALISQHARVVFEEDDIESVALPAGDYPKTALIKAAKLSLRFTGQFAVEVLAPISDDTSFIVAPEETANVEASAAARKLDGSFQYVDAALAQNVVLATNAEIELAATARLVGYKSALPSNAGQYHVNVGDNNDWSIPYSFLLKDGRNSDLLTDKYQITLKVTAPGGAVLNFALSRQYGRLLFIDAANELTVDDVSKYNAAQTLFQGELFVSHFKNKLGSQVKNAAGVPLGTFAVELKAVRQGGGSAPVIVNYDVVVEGIEAE